MRVLWIRKAWSPVLFLAAAIAAAGHPLQAAAAEETTPAETPQVKNLLVVSIASYDHLMGDVDFLGGLAGKPDLSKMLDGMLNLFTQGQGLAGLDKSQPWGAVVRTDGGFGLQPLAFVAVKNLGDLLEVLTVFGVESEDQGDGVFQLQVEAEAGPQTLLVKEHNGWAFVAQTSEALQELPDEPLSLLEGLDSQYDVAVRLQVQNIPEMFRQLAVQQLQLGLQQGLSQLPDDDPEDAALRDKLAENQLKSVTRLIEDSDHITIGWLVDAEQRSTHIDFSLVALEGTATAQQANKLSEAKSEFSGFLTSDAAVVCSLCSRYPEEDAQQMGVMIDALRTRALQAMDQETALEGAARDAFKSAVNLVIDVLKETAEQGTMDGGMLLELVPDGLTFAAGAHLVDAGRLETALRQVVELAANEPGFPAIQWNTLAHAGIQFHTVTVPIPESEDEVRQILGDSVDVAVGFGKDRVYLAAGKDPVGTVKRVIDQSAAGADDEAAPLVFSVALGKIVQFAAAQVDNPKVNLVADAFAQAEGKDHARITARAVPNGVRYRLEVEDGVLKAIGTATSAAGATTTAEN